MDTRANARHGRSSPRRPPRGSILVALTLLVTACGGPAQTIQREDPFTRAEVGPSHVRLHVQNDNFMDARLFALTLGDRKRLGIVGGKQMAVFSIPWDGNEPLQIEINMLAGPTCITPALDVIPGEILDLRIESVFTQTRPCG